MEKIENKQLYVIILFIDYSKIDRKSRQIEKVYRLKKIRNDR